MATSQICFGPYPQTIAQMNEWAKQVSNHTPAEVENAIHLLNGTISIRRR
jgi:hypothetical protein